MEAAYRKEADCMIVPMPREVDHHVAGNMSREIDLLAESWHVHRIIFDFAGTDFMDTGECDKTYMFAKEDKFGIK